VLITPTPGVCGKEEAEDNIRQVLVVLMESALSSTTSQVSTSSRTTGGVFSVLVTLNRLVFPCLDPENCNIIFKTLLHTIQHFPLLSELQILRSRIGQTEVLEELQRVEIGALVNGTRDAKLRSLVPCSSLDWHSSSLTMIDDVGLSINWIAKGVANFPASRVAPCWLLGAF